MIEIKNDKLQVTISMLGAEVRKVINAQNGYSYLHDGNPSIWNGISPLLFPAIGKSYNEIFKHKGLEYPMSKHGFARNNEFKVINNKVDSVELSLYTSIIDNYPFDLELRVVYKLDGNQLITKFIVINHGDDEALFSMGAHPAFKCPFDSSHKLEDYYLEFESDQVLDESFINQDGYFELQTKKRNITDKKIWLNPNIFDNDALVFSNFKSKYIDLKEKDTNKKIRVTIDGFTHLGIWAKPGRPDYVCIEPWCGRADDNEFNQELKSKDGVVKLATGLTWSVAYTTVFDY